MQVWIDVKFIHTNFGGCGLSAFGDIATFKNGQISLLGHYSPWSSKNLFDRNWLKKFMLVGIDVKCMYTNFGGRGLFTFGDIATFQKWPNFPFGAWTIIVHGHQKIESIGIGSKNSCKYGLMSSVCTPILVGVVSPLLEILQLSKKAKFPFRAMDYSPWSSKNSINRNRLKKNSYN